MAGSKVLSLGLLAVMIVGLLLFVSGCAQTTSEETTGSTGFDWTFIVLIVVIVAAFYLFMIRPQSTRRKQQQKMMTELKPGDQVIAAGGIYGEIESVDENTVVLKVESEAKIRVAKQSVVLKR